MRRTGRIAKLFVVLLVCIASMVIVSKFKQHHNIKQKEVKNGYITQVSGTSITYLQNGKTKNYDMKNPIASKELIGMADLVFQNDKVVTIKSKPNVIAGKLLRINDHMVTVQNYGDIEVVENPSLYYQSEQQFSQGDWHELTVGQEPLRWIVADGKICGVVLPSKKVRQIRVLLKMGKEEYGRKRVIVTSKDVFYSMSGGQTKPYAKGQKVTVTADSFTHTTTFFAKGNSEILLDDYPFGFAGNIEISKKNNELYVINELPIQDYLCGVVPGEMSASSPKEALKAQAICARSYLLQQMENSRLSAYGAHVDDTVSFQVYGTQPKDERSNQAVYETKNQILVCKGKPVSAYFYSTGSGSSASAKEVWNTTKDISYLSHFIQNSKKESKDLSEEKAITTFLTTKSDTLEQNTPWYRWSTKIDKKIFIKGINDKIKKRCQAEPSNIQVKGDDGKFHRGQPKSITELKRVEVVERGASGVVTALEIESQQEVIRIYSQYSIRMIFGDTSLQYERKDGSTASGLNLLPSGFFVIHNEADSYRIEGGGYGHGVGMSQNGASELARQGKSASEILAFYFSGTSIETRDFFE